MCSSGKKKKKTREEYVFNPSCISISSSSLSFFSSFPPFFFFFFLLFLHFGSLISIIFGLEIESQRLDFHVDATWKKSHIRDEQPIKIESQKLNLQTLNRVSQTRNASKKYSLETRTTNYIVGILWPFGHFGPNNAESTA